MKKIGFKFLLLFALLLYYSTIVQAANLQTTNTVKSYHTTIRSEYGTIFQPGSNPYYGAGIPQSHPSGGVGGGGSRFFHYCNTNNKKNY